MPVIQQRKESIDANCNNVSIKSRWQAYDKALDIINPIHLPGSDFTDLLDGRVIAGVSILPKSPLLTAQGCSKLVSFLVQLPQPSIVFLADTLNKHNVKAMAKLKKGNKMPSDEKALATALKEGDVYHKMMSEAISQMEKARPDKQDWVKLLRYAQVEEENDGNMKIQEEIAHRHYQTNNIFKERIDKMALEFLTYRRPQSKNHETRLPYVVNYLVSELPLMVTGLKYQGERYQTVVYPTAASKASYGPCMANSMFYLVRDIHTNPEFAALREELVSVAGQQAVQGVTLLPIADEQNDEPVLINGRQCLPTLIDIDSSCKTTQPQKDAPKFFPIKNCDELKCQ